MAATTSCPKWPRRRLHWATWLAMAGFAAGVIWVRRQRAFGLSGWPFLETRPRVAFVDTSFGIIAVQRDGAAWPMLLNGMACMAVLAAIAFAVEGFRQPRGRWFAIGIRELLLIMAVVAWLIAWPKYDIDLRSWPIWDWLGVEAYPNGVVWPWYIKLSINFGVGCTIYTAGLTLGKAALRVLRSSESSRFTP